MMTARMLLSMVLGTDCSCLPLQRKVAMAATVLCAKHVHDSSASLAGHNRWSKIGRKKAVVDLEKSKVIQKYSKQIVSIIRSGGGADIDANVQLASVIERAKDAGLSKASINAAISNATSKQVDGEMAVYEGRAEDGYMLVIEVMTDNKNRTRPFLRKFLQDNKCILGEAGSSLFNFEHKGIVRVPRSELHATNMEPLDLAIEVGAEDAISDHIHSDTADETEPQNLEKDHEAEPESGKESGPMDDPCIQFRCEPRDLKSVSDAIKSHSFTVSSASLEYVPKSHVELDHRKYNRALRLINMLSEQDDVMDVYDNFVKKGQ